MFNVLLIIEVILKAKRLLEFHCYSIFAETEIVILIMVLICSPGQTRTHLTDAQRFLSKKNHSKKQYVWIVKAGM